MANFKLRKINKKKVKICIKMDKTVITFGNTEIGNTNFNNIKILFLMNNINVYKIVVVSYKISLGKNGFK